MMNMMIYKTNKCHTIVARTRSIQDDDGGKDEDDEL